MFWLNRNRMRLVVVGIVAVMVLSRGSAKADFTFGEPTNLGPVINSSAHEYSHCLSSDGLELYFGSSREGSLGSWDLWVTTRTTTEDAWEEPKNLGQLVNSPRGDHGPTLSSDGLELYFNSSRLGGAGSYDIWVTRRTTKADSWGQPENIGAPVNSAHAEYNPTLSSEGLELYFAFSAEVDLWEPKIAVTRRETINDPWGSPVILGPVVNNWTWQDTPWISSDGLVLMFTDYGWDNASPRPGGFGGTDILYVRRATKDSEWSEPMNLGPAINTAADEDFAMISVDGTMLYFNSTHCGGSGSHDLWEAPILPVADFDDDGTIGMGDLLMLVEAWETDDPKCDIGPMPWGDGVVDAADLDILMDHWNQETSIAPVEVELIAHWAFDETKGMKAYDSAGVCDANLMGDPVWQPEGGMVGGAIELDGMGDYVSVPFVLPRPDKAFSIFAWVKGGDKNHVIISESGSYGNFLLQADFIAGNLMTSFQAGFNNHLYSETPIIDGQWHHVGFVWNGYPSNRILYVDGIEVARDTLTECMGPGDWYVGQGIYIGASWGLDTHHDYYWNGLIDDVRIYEGALSAEDVAALVQ